jgi:hypothetical protein
MSVPCVASLMKKTKKETEEEEERKMAQELKLFGSKCLFSRVNGLEIRV